MDEKKGMPTICNTTKVNVGMDAAKAVTGKSVASKVCGGGSNMLYKRTTGKK